MPKYYVRSGYLEQIVIADNPEEAAYRAVCRASGKELDKAAFYIDERGFRGPIPDDTSFNTEFLPEYMLNVAELLNKWEN